MDDLDKAFILEKEFRVKLKCIELANLMRIYSDNDVSLFYEMLFDDITLSDDDEKFIKNKALELYGKDVSFDKIFDL